MIYRCTNEFGIYFVTTIFDPTNRGQRKFVDMRYDIVITSDLMNRVQHIIYIQLFSLLVVRKSKSFTANHLLPHSEIFKRCKGYRLIKLIITSFRFFFFLRTKSSVANHFLANDINPVVTLRAPEESSCLLLFICSSSLWYYWWLHAFCPVLFHPRHTSHTL